MSEEAHDKSAQEADDYEARLQRRLQLLKRKLDEDKVHINPDLQVIESLKAVRYAPDGSVDLSTVDGLVRSLALAVEGMHVREAAKESASLKETQTVYFEFIERTFGQFYKVMRDRTLTPHDAGRALSEGDSCAHIASKLPDFRSVIHEYWESVSYSAQVHVEDMRTSLKAVFGGDLFPAHNESIASKCGIYADTIILPDPFVRSNWLFDRWSDQRKVYFFIKHAMNLLQYQALINADLDIPIVVVLPDQSEADNSERQFYLELGKADALLHAEKLFGRPFSSAEELMDFTAALDTPDTAIAAVKDPGRVLFDTEWKGDAKSQLTRAMSGDHSELLGMQHPGHILASQAIGRMAVSNELLLKARRLQGTPIIDAPTSWRYFAWKLEYDAERTDGGDNSEALHVMRGLQTLATNEMEWLGRIPHDALIEMRQQGALDEIRTILGKGIEELATANPNNFYRSADQVFDNIHSAFAEHKSKIEELKSKRWRFATKDIGTWLAVGTLEVAAAATGMPVFGLSAVAANQLVDAPKLKDIPASIRELARESARIKKSPVGMLFAYADT